MAENSQQLKERLIKLSDEELIEIVLAAPGEYRQEAIDIAKTELKWRNVEIPKPEAPEDSDDTEVPEDAGAPASDDPFMRPRLVRSPDLAPGNACFICGGPLRQGTLVAEKELTVVFGDDHEERFVKVNACTQCGQLSLVVDFDTDVQQ
jgi:hypothetical protein